jgi:hypothetical protein
MKKIILFSVFLICGCQQVAKPFHAAVEVSKPCPTIPPADSVYPMKVSILSSHTEERLFQRPFTTGTLTAKQDGLQVHFTTESCAIGTGSAPARWIDVDHHRIAVLTQMRNSELKTECLFNIEL